MAGRFLPAAGKRLASLSGQDENRAYANAYRRIITTRLTEMREGRAPVVDVDDPVERAEFLEDAKKETNAFFALRTIASWVTAAPMFDSPYQAQIDAYRAKKLADPENADDWFLEHYGDEFFALTQSFTRSTNGIPPTLNGLRIEKKYQRLLTRYCHPLPVNPQREMAARMRRLERAGKLHDAKWLKVRCWTDASDDLAFVLSDVDRSCHPWPAWRVSADEARSFLFDVLLRPSVTARKPTANQGGPWQLPPEPHSGGGMALGTTEGGVSEIVDDHFATLMEQEALRHPGEPLDEWASAELLKGIFSIARDVAVRDDEIHAREQPCIGGGHSTGVGLQLSGAGYSDAR